MKLNRYREKFILLGGTIGIGALSLLITLWVYNVQIINYEKVNNENKIKDVKNDDIKFNVELSEAQKVIAQNLINELNELGKVSNKDNELNELGKASNKDNELNKLEKTSNKDNEFIEQDNVVLEVLAPNKEELFFVKPVNSNKFGMVYADERLVYSKTLEEWLTHKAIDFLAPADTVVIASAPGKVINIYEDMKYGVTMVIEHTGGYVSKYSGIKESSFVNVGDEVREGDEIAKVAMPYGFEMEEGSHLHFELLKDGKNVEPNFK